MSAIKRIIACGAAIAALSVPSFTAANASDAHDDPQRRYEISYVDSAGQRSIYGRWSSEAGVKTKSSLAVASDFEGQTWGACGKNTPADKTIRTFNRGRPPMAGVYIGKATLKCGSDTKGFRHIQKAHEGDWSALSARVTASNWRSFTDWAMDQSLKAPNSYCTGSNQAYNYIGQIEIREKGSGKIVGRYYPRISVSNRDGQIITAFPQTLPKGC